MLATSTKIQLDKTRTGELLLVNFINIFTMSHPIMRFLSITQQTAGLKFKNIKSYPLPFHPVGAPMQATDDFNWEPTTLKQKNGDWLVPHKINYSKLFHGTNAIHSNNLVHCCTLSKCNEFLYSVYRLTYLTNLSNSAKLSKCDVTRNGHRSLVHRL